MNNSTSSSNLRAEKLELAKLLEERERRVRENPLKYTKRHPKQWEATNSLKKIRSLFWGNRVGKTQWGAMEVASFLTGDHPVRTITPPIEVWAACPSYDAQGETTQPKLLSYLPENQIADRTYVKKGILRELILRNGSKVNFKSYEQGRGKFQGAGKRLIWFDEEVPKDIWDECFVRQEAGQDLDIIYTMTPIKGMTWVYDEIYLNSSNEDLFVSTAGWDDNPWLLESQKEQMARGLTPEALKARKEGRFVQRVGVVCPWWDRSKHLKEVEFNPDWSVEVGIDFGYSNPTAVVFLGYDYDDNVTVFDGFYEKGLLTKDIKTKIREINQRWGIEPEVYVADSAQAQDIAALNDDSDGDGLGVIGVSKASGTDKENWDEYRARRMAEYSDKITVSNRLMHFDEKLGREVNWFMQEVEALKWSEKKGALGDVENGARWDPRFPDHAVDSFSYNLVSHLDAPDRPGEKVPGHGKTPGTFIPPSPNTEHMYDDEVGEPDPISILFE